MKNLLRAGIHRVVRRKSRVITLSVIMITLTVFFYFLFDGASIFQVTDLVNQYGGWFVSLVGLLEFGMILGDDMRAKSVQIAIGCGIKRRDIVAAQWLEIALFTLMDAIVILALLLACCALQNVTLVAEPVRDILIKFTFSWIRISYASMFCMGVALWTQSTTVSTLLVLAYNAGLVKVFCEMLLTMGFLKQFGLTAWLPTSLEGIVRSRLSVGIFSLPHALGLAVYLVLFYAASCAVFQKKELEF